MRQAGTGNQISSVLSHVDYRTVEERRERKVILVVPENDETPGTLQYSTPNI